MTTFYAQPYDIDADGFYFETAEDFAECSAEASNEYGQPVEEFEIQFIDGDALDTALAGAWGLDQCNFAAFIEAAADWEYHEKIRFIIAKENGYAFDPETDDIDLLDVEIRSAETIRELAEQAIEDGWFGNVPEHLANYIDYDAIARDLACDYAETTIAGDRLVYRCG